jgi:hypothetical protein
MALLTHLIDSEKLAALTPDQRKSVEDHLDGLVAKTVMQQGTMEKLGADLNKFAKGLGANQPR